MLLVRGLHGISEDLATLSSQGPAVLSKAAAVVRAVGPYVDTIVRVVNDPALPQFIQRIEIIDSLEPSSPGSTTTAAVNDKSGVGLKHFIKPLDAYIYARKNPWAPWVVGGGIVAVLLGVGYRLGQRRAVR